MGKRWARAKTWRQRSAIGIAASLVLVACTGSPTPTATPTHIAQPTPDATVAAVLREMPTIVSLPHNTPTPTPPPERTPAPAPTPRPER